MKTVDKQSRASGIISGVAGAGIFSGGFDVQTHWNPL